MACITEAPELPPLPFAGESISRIWSRYPASIERLYAESEVFAERPGRQRRHVFDCMDGLRLIVFRALIGEMKFIHVSASAEEDSTIFQLIQSKRGDIRADFAAAAFTRFRLIAYYQRADLEQTWDQFGIPHWFIPDERS